jgi:hypothetical protein
MGPTKNATCLLPLDQRFKTVEAVEMSQLFGLCLSVSAVPSFIVHFCCRQQNKKLVVVEKNCVAKKMGVCPFLAFSVQKLDTKTGKLVERTNFGTLESTFCLNHLLTLFSLLFIVHLKVF